MKIRNRLTLHYTLVTAVILVVFALIVFWSFEKNRSDEFFHVLKKEAITKANLFLENRVDAHTMQAIYLNNREIIDEVEVAVYDTTFHLLYHDAVQIDIIQETEEMIREVVRRKEIEFYIGPYQGIGILYPYAGETYVLTAAALDGDGYVQRTALAVILIFLCLSGIIICYAVGLHMAKSALKPVSEMVDEVERITEQNLDSRLEVVDPNDEIGELAITFNEMMDRIKKSFDAQKMFVSNVAHEIRTPLTSLAAEFELGLRRERTSDEYRKILSNALIDTERLNRLSAGLLDFARANYDPGQIKMKPRRVDEIVLDAMESVLSSHKDFTVDVIFEQEPETETQLSINGNEYLLKTAFVNLIVNNCKYSANKRSQVGISYFEDKIILRFSDTGIGIAPEDLEHLFTPFYRGRNKSFADGTGIGLALVHKIVTMHRGTVKVNSTPGEGTVFTVEFPHL